MKSLKQPRTYQRKQVTLFTNSQKIKKPRRKLSKETEITKDTQTSTCKECHLKDINNQELQFKIALKEAIEQNEEFLIKIARLEAMLSAAQDEIEQRDECILELYDLKQILPNNQNDLFFILTDYKYYKWNLKFMIYKKNLSIFLKTTFMEKEALLAKTSNKVQQFKLVIYNQEHKQNAKKQLKQIITNDKDNQSQYGNTARHLKELSLDGNHTFGQNLKLQLNNFLNQFKRQKQSIKSLIQYDFYNLQESSLDKRCNYTNRTKIYKKLPDIKYSQEKKFTQKDLLKTQNRDWTIQYIKQLNFNQTLKNMDAFRSFKK